MIISIIIICLVGTLLHFLYELTGHNKIVALFAAVNESTWEHIKIALTPLLVWSLYDGYIFGVNPNYFIAKSISLLTIIIVIPLIFYTYTYFTKKAILPIDIITFYVAITLAQMMFYYIIGLKPLGYNLEYVGVVLLFIIFGFYMIATIEPVENFLFKDPISKRYGKEGHTEL